MTWTSITRLIGLTKPPTVLKMDIEGHEWTTIPAIIKSNIHVPDSFSFELHCSTNQEELAWHKRHRTAPEIGIFMELLYSLGYVLVDRHDNSFCPSCTEVVAAKLVASTRFLHHDTHLSSLARVGNFTHTSMLDSVVPYPSPIK